MREIDFLPSWYPNVRRQRRMLTVQAWATTVLVVAGLLALLITQRKADAARRDLAASKVRANQTIQAVHQLDDMLALQRQLVAKQRIVAELGLPVELSRVLSELGACLPREAMFTEIGAVTREPAAGSLADRAMGRTAPGRRLELRLTGIAPTEAEVTMFWTRLAQLKFTNGVTLIRTDEKTEGDHLMRAFEISLWISLDFQGGVAR